MKKSFEISSYGVEEMNQQELLAVDGGVVPIVPIIIGLGTLIGIIGDTIDIVDAAKKWFGGSGSGNNSQGNAGNRYSTTSVYDVLQSLVNGKGSKAYNLKIRYDERMGTLEMTVDSLVNSN